LYGYCGNRPIGGFDSSGLVSEVIDGVRYTSVAGDPHINKGIPHLDGPRDTFIDRNGKLHDGTPGGRWFSSKRNQQKANDAIDKWRISNNKRQPCDRETERDPQANLCLSGGALAFLEATCDMTLNLVDYETRFRRMESGPYRNCYGFIKGENGVWVLTPINPSLPIISTGESTLGESPTEFPTLFPRIIFEW
jgi:hypothetical protein